MKRGEMIDCLAELPIAVLVAIHHPVVAKRQEHARRACLGLLVSDMVRHGVSDVVIESRGPQDRHDDETFELIFGKSTPPEAILYSFATKEEPLLWLPDSIAGAFSDAELGKDLVAVEQLVHRSMVLAVHRI
ncbi:MAG: hypothetical protein U0W40_01350 [Acidimicrobiia bacterium]